MLFSELYQFHNIHIFKNYVVQEMYIIKIYVRTMIIYGKQVVNKKNQKPIEDDQGHRVYNEKMSNYSNTQCVC